MKDALGHGSNGNGSIGADIKERRATFGTYTGPDRRGAAEYPARGDSSNAAAAQALMSGLRANPTSAPTPFGRRAGDGVFKGEKTAGQKTNYATVMRARHGSM
jgi:hypothetical protein